MKHIFIHLAFVIVFYSCESQSKNDNGLMPAQDHSNIEDDENVQPGEGSVNNFVYSNDYFKFTIPYPKDWQCTPTQEGISATEDANTTTLCTMLKYKPGDSYYFNPSMLILAENVSSNPEIITGKLYLEAAKLQLLKSDKKYTFRSGITPIILGNLEFYKLNAEIQVNSSVRQEYYAAVHEGYALIFILTADSEQDLNLLQNALKNINFY